MVISDFLGKIFILHTFRKEDPPKMEYSTYFTSNFSVLLTLGKEGHKNWDIPQVLLVLLQKKTIFSTNLPENLGNSTHFVSSL